MENELNIQHQIISFDAHNGSIEVKYYCDAYPQGLIFNIDLPFDEGDFPSQDVVDQLIQFNVPKAHIKRILGLQQAVPPQYLQQYIPVISTEFDLAVVVRGKRNEMLLASDWSQVPDVPMAEEEREAWKEYRQLLRDLPLQEGFPDNITFPVSPLDVLR
jgi:hypothetical protein